MNERVSVVTRIAAPGADRDGAGHPKTALASSEPAPFRDDDTFHGIELSVIVPTFNERANVRELVGELREVLQDVSWEVIFVDDDSPDETAHAVRELAGRDRRVRCLHRIGRRGLSTACIEGMLSSTAPYLAVMDGDLQHDPRLLPAMLHALKHSSAELVVGSRYVDGGSVGDWNPFRAAVSRFATRLGRFVVPESLRDPMSGFFMLRHSLFDEAARNLSGLGFKILVDLLASVKRPVAFQEMPFVFRQRQRGSSKLDSEVAWEYLLLLADKLIGRYVPVRFVVFAMIGGLGVVVHVLVLAAVYRLAGADFVAGQATATLVAMVFNYSLNNVLTYRDRRRRGRRWFTGLLGFVAACSVGALANVGIAAYLFHRDAQWLLAAIAGVLTGAVWNYAVTSVYTWGRPKPCS